MRKLGIAVLVVGFMAVLAAMNMDVSVTSSVGRVNNLGLMNQRQNLVMLSAMFAFGGLLMILFGVRRENPRPKYESAYESKPCPFCAETIKKTAIKCKHCGSELEASAIEAPPAVDHGWTVRFDCEAWTYAEIVKKAKAMGLPVMKGEPTKVITGPYGSEDEAKDLVKSFQKLHGIEGYPYWMPKPN